MNESRFKKLIHKLGHFPRVGDEIILSVDNGTLPPPTPPSTRAFHVNTFRDELLGHTSLTHTPIYYVGYNEPSKEDEDWSLTVSLVTLPRQHPDAEPTHFQMVWRYINDDQAKLDYPLFNSIAAERNWQPLTPYPQTHTY